MKVGVMGAGHAGMLAAHGLAKQVKAAEITAINPRPDFVERIRLHQQIAGTGAAATPLASIGGLLNEEVAASAREGLSRYELSYGSMPASGADGTQGA